MNIQMPNEIEKNETIKKIILIGLKPKKNLFQYMKELFYSIGYRCIFWDTLDCFIFSILGTMALYGLVKLVMIKQPLSMIFAIAPVFYILLTLITEMKEKLSGLFELKMTCKFTIRHITAIRLICFSLLGIVMCTLMSTGVYLSSIALVFWNILIIALLSLLVTSLAIVVIMIYFSGPKALYISFAVWVMIYILPSVIFRNQWEIILSKIPTIVMLFSLLVLGWIYLKAIKRFLTSEKKEVIVNAYN